MSIRAATCLALMVSFGAGAWNSAPCFGAPDIPVQGRGREGTKPKTPPPKPGPALTVVSTPANCEVYVDGKLRGRTNANGRLVVRDLPRGRHTVAVRENGYLEWSREIDFRAAMELRARLEVAPLVTLTVVTKLPDFAVYLDNGLVGATDAGGQLVIPNVKQGSHWVKVGRQGYEDLMEMVRLTSDWTLNLTPARIPYERGLQMAKDLLTAKRPDEAIEALQHLVSTDPERPEGHLLMAQVHYDNSNFPAAGEAMKRAVERGGQITFKVTHDDLGGATPVNEPAREWMEYCRGELILTSSALQYKTLLTRHQFTASQADVREVEVNRRVGSKIGAFHIKVRISGREETFNFAPKTKSTPEARMIVDVISKSMK